MDPPDLKNDKNHGSGGSKIPFISSEILAKSRHFGYHYTGMAFLGVNKATALYRLNDDFFALFTPETPLNPGQNGLKRRSKMPKIWEKPHFSPLKSYVSMAYMAICLHFLKKPSPARSAGRTYIDQASCFFRPIPFIFISNEKWNPTVIFPKIFGQKTPYGPQKIRVENGQYAVFSAF